ncbi:hypothetical protein Bca4012_073494 [Brassica carinata]|uniref:Uncharacterized protein n=1 Tax=Brassica oleracea TaxID=3712 RepID=A0A3P6F0N7_BRAOL|nr:unnamed protein product [Brassica oleracea]
MSARNEKQVLTSESEQGSPDYDFKGAELIPPGCHRRWEVRLRRASLAETSTPVDKSFVESSCLTSSPGTEERAPFHRPSQHSSSSLTVAGTR